MAIHSGKYPGSAFREAAVETWQPEPGRKTSTMKDILVRPIENAKDLDLFIGLPEQIYADDPNWIQPLIQERRAILNKDENPYFGNAEAQLFLAMRGRRCVGRISAQIDHAYQERHSDATGHFGFIEAFDDVAIFEALLTAAQSWLAARNMKNVMGPFSFSINQEAGLLIDGFDTPPMMMMGHARPYYALHMDACGYRKAKDLIAYDYDPHLQLPPSMAKILDKVHRSGDLVVRPLSKARLEQDLDTIISIFNDAWSANWGFIPLTEGEVKVLARRMKMLVREEFVAIAEYKGEPAAMAVTLPNFNAWIADLKGKLLPFGWIKLLVRLMRPPREIRMPLMGVRKSFQKTGLGTVLALAVIDQLRRYHVERNVERAELSWILEDNVSTRRLIETMGGRPYKTYRVYERSL